MSEGRDLDLKSTFRITSNSESETFGNDDGGFDTTHVSYGLPANQSILSVSEFAKEAAVTPQAV